MSNAILNLSEGANVIDLELFEGIDPEDFAVIDTNVAQQGNTRETLYQFIGTDENHPATLRVGWYKTSQGPVNISVKISTYVVIDNGTDPAEYEPASAVLAFTMPVPSGVPDAEDMSILAMNLLGVLFPSASAGDPALTRLSSLAFGVTDILV